MTQLELASVLDIHRVSLFRCLQQLRELGILCGSHAMKSN